jgi:hypothetical protein
MKFTVDGVEQTSGVSGGNGTWNFNWNVAPLKDGVYTIGAIAVDALGTRGAPMLKQVTLARGAASPVTNVTGGYNDVFESGVTKRVVELGWDASPEGSVTGYEVWNGATQVCSASLYLECMDLSPASSGSTVYTIKTLYTDAAGNPGSVSTDYTLNAPASGAGSGDFWFSNSTSISQTKCIVPYGGAKNTGPGTRKDLPATNPSGTEATWTNAANGNAIWGCMPPFSTATTMPAQANGMVVSGYFRNTLTTATVCKVGVLVYRYPENLNPLISAANGGAGDFVIPANTQTPTQFTTNYTTPSANLAAGDQLTVFVGGFSASGTNGNDCRGTTMYYNSTARPLKVTMPFGGSGGSSTLQKPSTPTGLTVTANADGTRTVQWTRPASSTPAVEYYRIYRDGQNYTERYDTLGEPGSGTLQYVDTNTGGTSHTYRVTSVAATMAESTQLGPVSG